MKSCAAFQLVLAVVKVVVAAAAVVFFPSLFRISYIVDKRVLKFISN